MVYFPLFRLIFFFFFKVTMATKNLSETVSKEDVGMLRCIKRPPEPIKKVLHAVFILLGHHEHEVTWKYIQSKYLQGKGGFKPLHVRVREFDVDTCTTETVKRAKVYLQHLTPEIVKMAACAAHGLSTWCMNIIEIVDGRSE